MNPNVQRPENWSWFRIYSSFVEDHTFHELNGHLFKCFFLLYGIANENTPRGDLPMLKQVAFRLRTTETEAADILNELERRGFLKRSGERLRPTNWDSWQCDSDSSTVRVQRHRERILEGELAEPWKKEAFEKLWNMYPSEKRVYRAQAFTAFNGSVTSEADVPLVERSLKLLLDKHRSLDRVRYLMPFKQFCADWRNMLPNAFDIERETAARLRAVL